MVVPVLSKNMHTPLFLKLIQRWDFLTMYCSELHNIGKQAAVSMGRTGAETERWVPGVLEKKNASVPVWENVKL